MKLQVSSSILYNYLISSLNFYCVIKQYIYIYIYIYAPVNFWNLCKTIAGQKYKIWRKSML